MPAKPSELSGPDFVAFLIGKLIMAWGLIDQRLYSDIVRLTQVIEGPKYPQDIEIDPRFAHRLRHWRRLAAVLCQDKPDVLKQCDVLIDETKELGRVRYQFAHGYVFYMSREPRLQIFEHGYTANRVKYFTELAKQNPNKRILASELHPQYTVKQLAKLVKVTEKIDKAWLKVTNKIHPLPKLKRIRSRMPQ